MIRTRGLTRIVLSVRDVERTFRFYHDVFGFRLVDPADIDAAAKEIERAGGKITHRGDFCPGEPYIFFTDPDGYKVEVWYENPTTAGPASD